MTKYYNVYGARYNKDKTRVNVTLIRNDEDDERDYATISLKVADKDKIVVKEKGVYIPVKFLQDLEETVEKTDKKTKRNKKPTEKEDNEDTLPF